MTVINRRSFVVALALVANVTAAPTPAYAQAAATRPAIASPRPIDLTTPTAAQKAEAAIRLGQAKEFALPLGRGRVLYAQYAKAAAGKPTLLFLPGVNRNLVLQEPSAKSLLDRGFGVAAFSLSVQPFSINALDAGVRPAFRDKAPKLEDFAAETQAIAAHLEKTEGLNELVPVTLSYTGAFSPLLRGFSLVVDAVPMTSALAASPDLSIIYNCESVNPLCWNPFLKPSIVRSLLDLGYRTKWSQQTDSITEQFNLNKSRRDDMIAGYTTLSVAVEGADWAEMTLPAQTRHVLLLAGQEAPALLKSQLETFKRMRASRNDALLIVVEDSSHIVPVDQPEAFAQVLDLLTGPGFGITSGVVVVDPKTRKITPVTGAQVERVLSALAERTR